MKLDQESKDFLRDFGANLEQLNFIMTKMLLVLLYEQRPQN